MTLFHRFARFWALILFASLVPCTVIAAPFAAYVIDARSGKPLYRQNENTRLHPASLTKMMTLYLAFNAIERGQLRLDTKILISRNAAAEPPSKLGLRAGQRIELRYLIRAAAIKSANDAATAIGEGIAGSEAAFARQMTQVAHAIGMKNTQFRNANGLTQEGHYSTAHDMTILGRRLFYDFPQYYNIFSRRSADAGIAKVVSTNRRFLDAYSGADGIKTGYTRAAGFNLTASAQRGKKRLVATVFGGTSTAQRNQVMAQILDAGFKRAPSRVSEVRPQPSLVAVQKVVRRAKVEARPAATQPQAHRLTLTSSARPQRAAPSRASALASAVAAAQEKPVADAAPASALRLASSTRPKLRPSSSPVLAEAIEAAMAATPAPNSSLAAPVLTVSTRPVLAPRAGQASTAALGSPAEPAAAIMPTMSLLASPAPSPRSEAVILATMGEGDISEPETLQIVSRPGKSALSWGVSLGMHKSRAAAERLLLTTALQAGGALSEGQRQVRDTNRGFEARLVALDRATAELTCDRLLTGHQPCTVITP